MLFLHPTANHVLTEALKPGVNGIPPTLFAKCKGLMLISIVQAGFIFSGSVGTGILLARREDGSWSLPSAVGLGGMGWGFLLGASVKDLIIFYFDETSLRASASDVGLKLSGQVEVTGGPFGRSTKLSVDVTNKGLTGSFAVALSRGGFVGLNLNGSVVSPRHVANTNFYGQSASAQDILFHNAVTLPENKATTLLETVYMKLTLLQKGATIDVETAPADQKAAALSAIEAAVAHAASVPGVERIDAAAEAAREQS